MTESDLNAVSEKILRAAYKVSNKLGVGFLEKVYENALVHELRSMPLQVQQQVPFNVLYEGIVVGKYEADILVNNLMIVEIKAVRDFDEIHSAQCMNYLKASGRPVCLLLNFGTTRLGIKRISKYTPESLQALGGPS